MSTLAFLLGLAAASEPVSAQQLDRHLRAGGGIAVVRVKTDAEERVAYAILLRHATAGVQTHEVRSSQNGR